MCIPIITSFSCYVCLLINKIVIDFAMFRNVVITGSFMVINSDSMEDVVSMHHRKEEIADIKFSPGRYIYFNLAVFLIIH